LIRNGLYSEDRTLQPLLSSAADDRLSSPDRRVAAAPSRTNSQPALVLLSATTSASCDNYSAERDHFLPNVALITMSLLVASWSFPDRLNLTRRMDAQSPVNAAEFIKTSHSSVRMLNDYAFGGV
jgi:hypothetical protein